jgi:membrane-associated phospholipid phosphatase
MGEFHPVCAADDHSLYVHFLFLCLRAVPVSKPERITRFGTANYICNPCCRCLLLADTPAVIGCASTTQHWTGVIFRFLHIFDQPYNLFPSLHIAFRTILADLYAKHTKGVVRWASHIWFILIGFSTLLTYQHHIVDIVGGFALAAFCFYLFREKNERLS